MPQAEALLTDKTVNTPTRKNNMLRRRYMPAKVSLKAIPRKRGKIINGVGESSLGVPPRAGITVAPKGARIVG